MNNIAIIAPHPDDELIGCYTLFAGGMGKVERVLYVDTPNSERAGEAMRVCGKFGALYQEVGSSLHHISAALVDLAAQEKNVLVPSPEGHSLHNMIYYMALRTIPAGKLGVYSVYMTDYFVRELEFSSARIKRELLNEYYPSQRSLWEYDHKYWLYEGIALI